jgi:putative glutamine amidotransferase
MISIRALACRKNILPLVFAWIVISGCTHDRPLKIGVSRASPNYIQWIRLADSAAIPVDLYPMGIDSALKILDECSGLLLTGGDDIFPGMYGSLSDTTLCTGFDRHRDTAEKKFLEKALSLKMPVFGICRGNQFINIALGGTLIRDIPTQVACAGIHRCADYLNCFHLVTTERKSILRSIVSSDSSMVTTNHHQAIDRLAPGLRVSARSTDGLIEGVEWVEPKGKSFLLGVQWHPERMKDTNPLSGPLAKEFLKEAHSYTKHH